MVRISKFADHKPIDRERRWAVFESSNSNWGLNWTHFYGLEIMQLIKCNFIKISKALPILIRDLISINYHTKWDDQESFFHNIFRSLSISGHNLHPCISMIAMLILESTSKQTKRQCSFVQKRIKVDWFHDFNIFTFHISRSINASKIYINHSWKVFFNQLLAVNSIWA